MMNRTRFDQIVASYGADPRRWPAHERDAAVAFAQSEGVDLSESRAIDALLDCAPSPEAPGELLQARILRARRPAVRRMPVGWALAACMLGGVLVGYGAGLNAPVSRAQQPDVDALIDASFAMMPSGDWSGDSP
jgi:hypothetical protein